MITKKAENVLPESNPGYWAKFPSSVPTELRTHDKNLIRNVFKLNFGKVSPTNQINERKVLRSVCAELQVRGVRSARRAMRGGLVIGARIVCDAMRCAGCDAMRCARELRCTGCNAMRCARAGCRRRHAF